MSNPHNPWAGPPTSGNSTPLRENIPESPTTDGFSGFGPQISVGSLDDHRRRARAGTLPSRFSPGAAGVGVIGVPFARESLPINTTKPPPARSPLNGPSIGLTSDEQALGRDAPTTLSALSNLSNLTSRGRAGSVPQRSPFAPVAGHVSGTSSPFGYPVFSTAWTGTGRERGATLASIASVGSNGPGSPAASQYSREGAGEKDMHGTLTYLDLGETPQPHRAQPVHPVYLPGLGLNRSANRFRSYSVNNQDKYADEEDEEYYDAGAVAMGDQNLAKHLQEQIAATENALRRNAMTAQAMHANMAALSGRPRSQTTGILDTPRAPNLRTYIPTPSRLDSSHTAAEARMPDGAEYDELSQSMAAVTLGRSNSRNTGNGLLSADDQGPEGPTSALWLGSIPTSTTVSTLQGYFEKFGPILSSRVLTHKNCGFVNFEKVESAVAAKLSLNGKEIFPGAGPIRINFAKPPSASNTPGHDGVFPSPSPDPFARGQTGGSGANGGSVISVGDASTAGPAKVPPTVPQLHEMTDDILRISETFGASPDGLAFIRASVDRAITYTEFIDEIPPIREPTHARMFDAPKLRDIRKKIDQAQMTTPEIEQIAIEMLPEIVELSSDYLGNTVVQKLFERCSDEVRDQMLARIAPHMAEIGCHKNGTWAAQKIIDQCKQPHQAALIAKHIHAYTVPLFLDQYGNYVLQGMLKYGSPHTDFLFETMLSKMWDLGKERYGARAMRACLESHYITKDQQAMLAAAIALHSVQLATNQNGGLLLTWFLDTCNLPHRRTVLAPQLVPHLVHLCTHKVAYLTVLKVINQKPESEARETILKALFFSKDDQVLEGILSDPKDGATFIFKAITTPFYDETTRTNIVEKVRSVLVHIKADRGTGSYKRLMDEVGLSTRNGGAGGGNGSHARDHANGAHDRTRPSSRQTGAPGQHQQQYQQHYHQTSQQMQQQAQFQDAQAYTPQAPHAQLANQYGPANGQFYGSPAPAMELGYGSQRSDSAEPSVVSAQYPYSLPGNVYNVGNPALPPGAMQQVQYQLPRPAGYYSPVPAGFNGYASATPPMEQYRVPNPINGSPVPPQANPGPHSQFGASGYSGMNGFPYAGGQNGMQNGTYLPDHGSNNRRGRVSRNPHYNKYPPL